MPTLNLSDTTVRRRIRARTLVLGAIAVGCWVMVLVQPEVNWWWLLLLPAFWPSVVSLYFAKHLWLTRSRRITD